MFVLFDLGFSPKGIFFQRRHVNICWHNRRKIRSHDFVKVSLTLNLLISWEHVCFVWCGSQLKKALFSSLINAKFKLNPMDRWMHKSPIFFCMVDSCTTEINVDLIWLNLIDLWKLKCYSRKFSLKLWKGSCWWQKYWLGR